jgi:sugar phosphate isomerase/epimerase
MTKTPIRVVFAGNGAEIVSLCRQYGCGIELGVEDSLDPGQFTSCDTILGNLAPRALHGPFGDLCAGSYDPKIREVTRDRFELACQLGREVRSPDIILHHGYVPGTTPPKNWLSRCSAFWKDFLKGKDLFRFHVENMLEWDGVLLGEVIDIIGDDRVDVCLDIGHAHCNSRETPIQWIERLRGRIGWVHLHDNHGEWDEHLALGRGTIPLQEACMALLEHAPQAVWSLEAQDEGLVESMEWLLVNGFHR